MSSPTGAAAARADRSWLLLGLAAFALFAFATLIPRGDTWGLHALAYFPLPVRLAALGVCLALLWRPVQARVVDALEAGARPLLGDSLVGRLLPWIAALGGYLVFRALPVQTEVYGDTRTILRWWADNAEAPVALWGRLAAHPLENQAVVTQLLHRTMAHVLGMPIEQTFRILSPLFGAAFLGLWIHFVRTECAGSAWAPLLLVLGGVLGSHQIFFGHIETYAFVFLTIAAFLISGARMLDRRASFLVVCVLFAFALRVHGVTIFFLPAFAFLAASWLARRVPRLAPLLTWRRLAATLVAPSLVAAAALYFFWFRSFDAPHTGVSGAREITFLPLFPPPPPLDYSLLAPAHLLDLGNVLLLIAAPVVLALAGLLLLHRRALDWRHPRVIFAVLAAGYPLLFFAAVNPALSMPRDWDLFGLSAAPLLLLLATLLTHADAAAIPRPRVHGTALAFSGFAAAFWVLNASPARLSERLEDVGEHVFRTYHTNASYLIGTAQGMDPDTARAIARRQATLERLAPHAVGEDREYTHLLLMLASLHRERGDRAQTLAWAERATTVAPGDRNLALWYADHLLWAGEPDRARARVEAVLEADPANVNALMLGALAAAQRNDAAGAMRYLERAQRLAPGDAEIASWIATIRGGTAGS